MIPDFWEGRFRLFCDRGFEELSMGKLRLMIPGIAAVFIVTAVPLAALDMNEIGPQGGIPVPLSNTSRSTAGLIGADIDNF
jgi:hypothetical protein